MKHVLGQDTTPMGMALLLWVCTLPVVAIFVLPYFGVDVAAWTVVGLLAAVLIVCRIICAGPRRN